MTLADLVLPESVLTYFEVVRLELDKIHKLINIYLDECSLPPSGKYTYLSKGFTEAVVIQDFPLRGKAVYLHVRRRKWLEKETGKVITSTIDLAHEGTRLTQEFVAFLKGAD